MIPELWGSPKSMKIRKNTNPDTKCVSKPSGLDKIRFSKRSGSAKNGFQSVQARKMKKLSGGGVRGGP
jgi:hypothetical protein